MPTNNLPPNWSWVKLGDMIEKISTTGIKLKQKEYLVEGKYPVVDQGQELVGGYSNNDSLIVNTELPIIIFGDHTKVKKFIDFKFIAGADGVIVIKPKKEFFPKLFFYFLHCIQFPDKGYARHFQYVEKENIPLPPLPEQKKIVEKIEELFSQLDSGVASLKKAKEQIRLFRQSVLASAFSGRLHQDSQDLKISRIKTESGKFINPENPEILVNHGSDNLPEGWEWVKLGEIISPSKARFEPLQNDNVKYIGLEHIEKRAGIILSYADSNTVRSTKSVFKKGNLLYGKLRPYLNKIAIAEFDGVCSTDILVFENQEKLSNKFLKYRLLCEDYVNYAQKNMKGVQHPRINFKSISEFEISLPQHTMQTQIVEEIEKRFSEADNLEKAIDDSLTKAETLRQSILKKAFEGRLI